MNDNMDNKNNGNKLSKVLGRTDIIAIGFGTMVGWSWIMMTTSWVNEAGILGAVIAFLIGGAIILAIGLVYGELTAALPLAGGEFAFIYKSHGQEFSLACRLDHDTGIHGCSCMGGHSPGNSHRLHPAYTEIRAADGDRRLSGLSVMGAGGCCRCSDHNPAESDRREIGTSFSGHGNGCTDNNSYRHFPGRRDIRRYRQYGKTIRIRQRILLCASHGAGDADRIRYNPSVCRRNEHRT